jgi:hypothetical protein
MNSEMFEITVRVNGPHPSRKHQAWINHDASEIHTAFGCYTWRKSLAKFVINMEWDGSDNYLIMRPLVAW